MGKRRGKPADDGVVPQLRPDDSGWLAELRRARTDKTNLAPVDEDSTPRWAREPTIEQPEASSPWAPPPREGTEPPDAGGTADRAPLPPPQPVSPPPPQPVPVSPAPEPVRIAPVPPAPPAPPPAPPPPMTATPASPPISPPVPEWRRTPQPPPPALYPDLPALQYQDVTGSGPPPEPPRARPSRSRPVSRSPERTPRPRGSGGPRRTAVIVLPVLALVVGAAVGVALRSQPPDSPAPPGPPAGVQVQPPAITDIKDEGSYVYLRWTDPTGGTAPFVVSRMINDEDAIPMRDVQAGQTETIVAGLDPAVRQYCFVVLALTSPPVASATACTPEREV